MKKLLAKYTPLGMFIVIKPIVFWLFLLLWNVLGVIAVLLNGGFGRIRNPNALLVFVIDCLSITIYCLLPFMSRWIRDRWTKPGYNFKYAIFGLSTFAIIGVLFAFMFYSEYHK
jgi:hypothetical protein